MDSISSPPLLKLSVEHVHHLDPVNLQRLWSACRNASNLLQDGPRLENLSDRLWFKQSSLSSAAPALDRLSPTTRLRRKTHSDAEPPPSSHTQAVPALPRPNPHPSTPSVRGTMSQRFLETILPMDLTNLQATANMEDTVGSDRGSDVAATDHVSTGSQTPAENKRQNDQEHSATDQPPIEKLSPSFVTEPILQQESTDQPDGHSDAATSIPRPLHASAQHPQGRPQTKRPHAALLRTSSHRAHTVQRSSASKKPAHEHTTGLRRNASAKSVRILEHAEAIPRHKAPQQPSNLTDTGTNADTNPLDVQAKTKASSPALDRKSSANPLPITSARSRPSTSSLTSLEPRSVVKGFEPTPTNSITDLNRWRAKDEKDNLSAAKCSTEVTQASSLSFNRRPIVQATPQSSVPPPLAVAGSTSTQRHKVNDPPHVSIQPPTNAQSSKKGRNVKRSMFFISSPSSESDGESIMRTLATKDKKLATPNAGPSQDRPVASIGASYATSPARPSSLRNESVPPTTRRPAPQSPAPQDEASDAEDDGDSSGWGSEASSQSAASAPNEPTTSQLEPRMFLKRTPTAPGDLARVNSRTGLLTQLFKPSEDDEKAVAGLLRNPSAVGLVLAARSKSSVEALPARRGLQPSKSATALPVMSYSGEDAFPKFASTESKVKESQRAAPRRLGGRPDDVEMSDSEGEEESEPNEAEQGLVGISPTQQAAFNAAMARYQARHMPVAGPQTPRTTRRNMLSTELSESLRLGLLWDRQTTMNLLGKPTKVRIPPVVGPTQPTPQVMRRHTACNGELQPSRATASVTATDAAADKRKDSQKSAAQESYSQQSQPFSDGFHHAGW